MARLKASDKYFTHSEIGAFCRNAMLASQRPLNGKVRPDKFPQLREFTEALMSPFGELVDEGGITPEELRYVLAASLYIWQAEHCVKDQ